MCVLVSIDIAADVNLEKASDLFPFVVFCCTHPFPFAISPCVIVWYGRNATHAEATAEATATATTHSPLYGHLTSGLSDL